MGDEIDKAKAKRQRALNVSLKGWNFTNAISLLPEWSVNGLKGIEAQGRSPVRRL